MGWKRSCRALSSPSSIWRGWDRDGWSGKTLGSVDTTQTSPANQAGRRGRTHRGGGEDGLERLVHHVHRKAETPCVGCQRRCVGRGRRRGQKARGGREGRREEEGVAAVGRGGEGLGEGGVPAEELEEAAAAGHVEGGERRPPAGRRGGEVDGGLGCDGRQPVSQSVSQSSQSASFIRKRPPQYRQRQGKAWQAGAFHVSCLLARSYQHWQMRRFQKNAAARGRARARHRRHIWYNKA